MVLWIIRNGYLLFLEFAKLPNILDSSTGDEEPLVDAAIDRGRGKVLALGDAGKLALVNTVRRALVGDVGPVVGISIVSMAFLTVQDNLQADLAAGGLASDELLPGVGALADDLSGVPAAEIVSATVKSKGHGKTNFLFLHSPEKANWFSGFPSGIL